MSKPGDLRQELAAAQEELQKAIRGLAPRHVGGEMERYKAAAVRVLALERELAQSLGQEHAMRLKWPVPWDTGAPLPHVLSSGHVTRLVYLAREPDPEWDGSYVNVIDSAQAHDLAVVSFEGCIIHKFGGPNDEVLSGHPLYGKGLEPYGAHEVVNSSWIAEQQTINSVHSQYSAEGWKTCRHFLLLFHDEMFECIASDFTATRVRGRLSDVLGRCVADLLGQEGAA